MRLGLFMYNIIYLLHGDGVSVQLGKHGYRKASSLRLGFHGLEQALSQDGICSSVLYILIYISIYPVRTNLIRLSQKHVRPITKFLYIKECSGRDLLTVSVTFGIGERIPRNVG